ncbi:MULTISPECIES: hypothetical protein [unclassified Rhodococcus (in: high G+C Gram-positive bacteria)]|nr:MULTISPECIES: hypothetical protein [unclassified Rhodococcus (in: high G+C Gram-positive bacteria)]
MDPAAGDERFDARRVAAVQVPRLRVSGRKRRDPDDQWGNMSAASTKVD